MDIFTVKHGNFVKYVRDTLGIMNHNVTPQTEEFLKKSPVDFLGVLKIVVTAGLKLDAIIAIVMDKMGVSAKNIPAERLVKIEQYASYFYELCKLTA